MNVIDIAAIALLAFNVYVIGAFLSWWTFFGVPVSMRP